MSMQLPPRDAAVTHSAQLPPAMQPADGKKFADKMMGTNAPAHAVAENIFNMLQNITPQNSRFVAASLRHFSVDQLKALNDKIGMKPLANIETVKQLFQIAIQNTDDKAVKPALAIILESLSKKSGPQTTTKAILQAAPAKTAPAAAVPVQNLVHTVRTVHYPTLPQLHLPKGGKEAIARLQAKTGPQPLQKSYPTIANGASLASSLEKLLKMNFTKLPEKMSAETFVFENGENIHKALERAPALQALEKIATRSSSLTQRLGRSLFDDLQQAQNSLHTAISTKAATLEVQKIIALLETAETLLQAESPKATPQDKRALLLVKLNQLHNEYQKYAASTKTAVVDELDDIVERLGSLAIVDESTATARFIAPATLQTCTLTHLEQSFKETFESLPAGFTKGFKPEIEQDLAALRKAQE